MCDSMVNDLRADKLDVQSDGNPKLFWRAVVPTFILFCGLVASTRSEFAETIVVCTLCVLFVGMIVGIVGQVIAVVAFEVIRIRRSVFVTSAILAVACAMVGAVLVYLDQMPS